MFGLAVKDDFTTEDSQFKDNNSGFLTDRTVVFLLTGQWFSFSYRQDSGFLTVRKVVFLLTVLSLKPILCSEPCIQMSQIDEKRTRTSMMIDEIQFSWRFFCQKFCHQQFNTYQIIQTYKRSIQANFKFKCCFFSRSWCCTTSLPTGAHPAGSLPLS